MRWVTDYHLVDVETLRRNPATNHLIITFVDGTTENVGPGQFTYGYPQIKNEVLIGTYVGLWEIEDFEDDRLISSGYRPLFVDGTDVIGYKRTWFPFTYFRPNHQVYYREGALDNIYMRQDMMRKSASTQSTTT